ncbi:MAG: DNA polymerase III subunit delta' [Deltaproteobacteria bacterium]|nr:DNA polymerase III subunit delta' [Deltaproteobacteria bacterium]MBW2078174.1 DNA polymerase III subunit delta' [Deltaproteobacteria bacterium]MBW2312320.1 DNA polymerase III subunit delta' [Deltaproteobacteria bacterium]
MKTFKDIRGQDKAIAFLRGIIANERVASAYLFAGMEGVGKTTTALAFARLLNCKDPKDEDACEQCDSCRKICDGNHPDIHLIEPEKDKKAISIEQIREIERHIAFSPVLARYRVMIIDPAERMTDEAANAFLKTLEEPPPRNVFILNVRDPGDLFPTIVSRCQRVPFKPLATEHIADFLTREEHVDVERARLAARLAEGSLGRAQWLASDELFEERAHWLGRLRNAVGGSFDILLDLARECSSLERTKPAGNMEPREEKIALMMGIWKSWYRDMLLIKQGGARDLIFNSDLSSHLEEASASYTVHALISAISVISRAERDLMNNRNPLLILERSLLGLKEVARLG